MQMKKEYKCEVIVKAAKLVFLKKGYTKTSMRDISKGCGIGLSNIYNYFKSKDELFRHIVAPLIAELEQMMNEHHNMNDQKEFLRYAHGESDEMVREHTQEYLRLINNYRDELILIMYKAQGSSLETFIDDYTERCTHQVLKFMDEVKRNFPEMRVIHTPFTYHVHTVWMFSFISEVIKHQLKPQEIRDAIEDYIQFEFAGWRALMNKHQTL